MSSERPSAAPSPPPEGGPEPGGSAADPGLAALVSARGAPLVDALERHAPGSRHHADGTGTDAFAAAAELGTDRDRCALIREAARLHEIGKVYVPAAVLAKQPDERTAEERKQLEAHFEAGYRLARGAGIPDQVCGWILGTRERFDGDGPDRLAGTAIPLEARVARAACVCDRAGAAPAVTGTASERRREAVAALRTAAGGELDPQVVDALTAALERISLAHD